MEETPKAKKGRKPKAKEVEPIEKKENVLTSPPVVEKEAEEKVVSIEQAGELVGKESVGEKKIISEPNHSFENVLVSFWNFLTSMFKF